MNVNRPIGINTYVAPQGPVGGNAPQPVTVAVNTYQAQPGQVQAAAGGNGVLSMIGNLLSGLVNFVKNAFSKIFGAAGTPPPPPPTAPTQPGTTTGGPDDATVAAQFGLLNTPQNVAAFKATLSAQQAEPNVLGPGMNNPEAAAELQQLLAQWGYPVQATSQFDAATADAVMKFKAANGLTENFQFSNGQPGVTPFVDNRTRAKMLELLTSGQAPAPGTATTPTQPTTPAQPTGDAAAIAAQFHLAPDAANVAAYQAAAAEALGKGAIGPGNAPSDAVSELQTLLAQWGYAVPTTGQFDQATIDGLLTFKSQNNLTDARFKMSDGSVGITPFVDEATQAVMLKKLEGAAAAPAPAPTPTPAPAPTPTAPATQYQAAGLSAEEAQIAAEQGILATRENFDAFVKEAQALEAQNAVGPGTTQKDAVTELQQILAQWGYAVQQNGTFDQATADAVIKFKRDNGVAATYKMADGTAGVHPFVDDATKAVMMKKLGLA
jgi:N-acetyl-anhydromuramyl-L-alanine amidase AmpD